MALVVAVRVPGQSDLVRIALSVLSAAFLERLGHSNCVHNQNLYITISQAEAVMHFEAIGHAFAEVQISPRCRGSDQESHAATPLPPAALTAA